MTIDETLAGVDRIAALHELCRIVAGGEYTRSCWIERYDGRILACPIGQVEMQLLPEHLFFNRFDEGLFAWGDGRESDPFSIANTLFGAKFRQKFTRIVDGFFDAESRTTRAVALIHAEIDRLEKEAGGE